MANRFEGRCDLVLLGWSGLYRCKTWEAFGLPSNFRAKQVPSYCTDSECVAVQSRTAFIVLNLASDYFWTRGSSEARVEAGKRPSNAWRLRPRMSPPSAPWAWAPQTSTWGPGRRGQCITLACNLDDGAIKSSSPCWLLRHVWLFALISSCPPCISFTS